MQLYSYSLADACYITKQTFEKVTKNNKIKTNNKKLKQCKKNNCK